MTALLHREGQGSYRYYNTDLHGEAGKMLVSEAFRTKAAQKD